MSISEEGFVKPQKMSTDDRPMSWKPGVPGDIIKAIFTGQVDHKEAGQYPAVDIYKVVGIEGFWNSIDEDGKPTGIVGNVVAGAPYSIWEKKVFSDEIRQAKRGQEILVKFIEMRKPKSGVGKSYKYIECSLGGMNEAWLAANSLEGAFAPAGENNTDPLA